MHEQDQDRDDAEDVIINTSLYRAPDVTSGSNETQYGVIDDKKEAKKKKKKKKKEVIFLLTNHLFD